MRDGERRTSGPGSHLPRSARRAPRSNIPQAAIHDPQSPLRILHLCYDHPDNPWCGGGGAGRTWAVNRILARRHEITVCCGPFPGAGPRGEPFAVRFLGRSRRYVASRLRYMHLARCLDARPFDLVVEEFSYYAPVFAIFPEHPLVTILQGRHGLDALRYRGVYGLLSLASEQLLLPRRRAVILVSEHLRPAVSPNARTIVLGQGADIPPPHLPAAQERHVLFLGRLDVWHKGLDLLIEAWARLDQPPLPLVIAGGGDTDRLQALAAAAGARRVVFWGRLSRPRAMAAIRQAAFVCLPSRMEGSPLVAYEALALGKPVLGSDIPPIAALVPNGEAGLLFAARNVDALTGALAALLDEATRRRLADGARRIGRDFRWERIAERQEAFYRGVVADWRS